MAIRTANRTAPELQDLLAGGRLVHIAAADLINRCADGLVGKCGYSPVGIMSAANAPDSLRTLRAKYPRLFLLVDGYSAVGANAKNCGFAFDKLGHGAIVCLGSSVTSAWKEDGGEDYLLAAVSSAQKARKRIERYVTVL